jgi:hypothetical protein
MANCPILKISGLGSHGIIKKCIWLAFIVESKVENNCLEQIRPVLNCTFIAAAICEVLKIDVSLQDIFRTPMKTGRLYLTAGFAVLTLLLAHCAKQANPTGGPKDTTPPVLVKSIPVSGTTMFREKSITVTFDEYFNLDKLNEKFLISPPVKDKPKISVKGKTLLIQFEGELKDSTTYTLNFPDIIKDVNEGNPISNFQYVFSTGKTLDSLSVTGNVVKADNLEADKNILVMLYANTADSAPRKILPDYITVADANGFFRINNVRTGTYRLYALADGNSNNRYDPPAEKFAFFNTVIQVDPVNNFLPPQPVEKDTVVVKKPSKDAPEEKKPKLVPFYYGENKLFLFTPDKKERYLSSSDRKMAWQLMFYLSLPPDTMKFRYSFEDGDKYSSFPETNKTGDTITVWLRDSLQYSQPTVKTFVTYPFTDSTGKILYRNDTLQMRYTIQKTGRGKQQAKKFQVNDNTAAGNIKPGQKIFFSSVTPFRDPDTTKIRLYNLKEKGKEKEKISMQVMLSRDSLNSRILHLDNMFKENEKYLLITEKGALGDIYGAKNDSTGLQINVRPSSSYGHLTMEIDSGRGKMIVQLMTAKENIIEERKIIKSGKADFPLLERGIYRVRIIYDLNGDGKWSTGDFNNRLQPEPVSYFPHEIEVRADFEIIEEWNVSQFHAKDKALREKKEVGK